MNADRRTPFLIYAACSLTVVAGLVWLSLVALNLEHAEQRARAESALKNAVGTALWRMDSAVGTLIAEQAAWRYFQYRPFYPAERAYTRMFEEVLPGEVLVPSPLLESPGEFIRLHFQVEPDGRITSPQVPEADMRDQAVSGYITEDACRAAEARLRSLSQMVGPRSREFASGEQSQSRATETGALRDSSLPGLAPDQEYAFRQQTAEMTRQSSKSRAPANWADNSPPPAGPAPQSAAALEGGGAPEEKEEPADDRAALRIDGTQVFKEADATTRRDLSTPPSEKVDEGPLSPRWFTGAAGEGPQLVFLRTVHLGGQDLRQGFWLDWPLLRAWLLRSAVDLLPAADLQPVYNREWRAQGIASGGMLASFPALLEPGVVPAVRVPILTPTRIALILTWAAVLLAVGAVGVVLRQSTDLAERRGRFVSAVTHELRTPLTTFCLYTQMLADGMVRDDDARAGYLGTLKGESQRLARIVENVLEYARLGRRTPPSRPRRGRWPSPRGLRGHEPPHAPADARPLLDSILPVLARRTAQCGMTLETDLAPADGVRLAADPQTLERILLNLVDNACKYAGEAPDKRIHLRAARSRAALELSVTDHGPGVPHAERHRIFAPFHRARRDSDGPSPGLGLGLALARGLARQLGGSLSLGPDPTAGGACFVLRIPAA